MTLKSPHRNSIVKKDDTWLGILPLWNDCHQQPTVSVSEDYKHLPWDISSLLFFLSPFLPLSDHITFLLTKTVVRGYPTVVFKSGVDEGIPGLFVAD